MFLIQNYFEPWSGRHFWRSKNWLIILQNKAQIHGGQKDLKSFAIWGLNSI